LQKARIIATDETVKIKLEHDIEEAEEQLAQFEGAVLPSRPPSAPTMAAPSSALSPAPATRPSLPKVEEVSSSPTAPFTGPRPNVFEWVSETSPGGLTRWSCVGVGQRG
jgi:hypothetical protein